jgi:hypothetical protein
MERQGQRPQHTKRYSLSEQFFIIQMNPRHLWLPNKCLFDPVWAGQSVLGEAERKNYKCLKAEARV